MQKTYFSAAVIVLTVLITCFSALAVETTKIDTVRNKETLTDSDTAVIEEFLADAVEEFLAKTDFSDIGSLRNTIISKGTSEKESGQFQYGPRFITALQKQITAAFDKISKMPEGKRKQLLTMNLLILINDMGSAELSKTALDYIQNPDVMIRYWAVSCLTNNNVLRQLNTADNKPIAEQFAQKLQAAAQTEQSGDVIILMAQFAAGLKQPAANEILNQLVQNRIKPYLNWQVKDEMVDGWILKALADNNSPDSTAIMAKNFALLYSLIVQRYILGQEALPAKNIRALVSVIVQGEKYLLRFVPDWPGNLKRAIEKGGGQLLSSEYDSLFGSATAAGKLPTAAGFDYGKNPDGSAKTAPPALTKPPKMEKQPEKTTEEQPEETTEEPNQ